MLELKFGTNEFREGKNTTIRKGIKWNIKTDGIAKKGTSSLVRLIDEKTGEKIGIGYITDTYIKQFDMLKIDDLIYQHDYNLIDLDLLYRMLVVTYRSFNKKSWVTIVNFNYSHDKQMVC